MNVGRLGDEGKERRNVGRFECWKVERTFLSAGCKHFDRGRSTFGTDGMEVKLSPELQAKLENIAAQQGRDSASLVHEAVERLVGYDEWFMRQVEEGLAQIDRGEVLEHDEVAARMEKLIAEKQRRT
jgi:predicted transcriptional regulator